jgi:hypothetical protein
MIGLALLLMIVPLFVLVAMSTVLYLSSKKKSPMTVGFILAGIHLAVFLPLALYAVHYHSSHGHGWDFPGPESVFLHMLYLIDMPISLLWPVDALRLSHGAEAFLFIVLASAQYFLWGFLLAWAFAFARKHQEPLT